jgi:hypothetical protein
VPPVRWPLTLVPEPGDPLFLGVAGSLEIDVNGLSTTYNIQPTTYTADVLPASGGELVFCLQRGRIDAEHAFAQTGAALE